MEALRQGLRRPLYLQGVLAYACLQLQPQEIPTDLLPTMRMLTGITLYWLHGPGTRCRLVASSQTRRQHRCALLRCTAQMHQVGHKARTCCHVHCAFPAALCRNAAKAGIMLGYTATCMHAQRLMAVHGVCHMHAPACCSIATHCSSMQALGRTFQKT